MTFVFRYAALSHVGKVRKNNQDSGFAGDNLLVLADGMGGPAGGDIASSIAVDRLAHLNQTPANTPQEADFEATQAIESAHQDLVEMSNCKHELRGLGTTCITVRRGNDFIYLTHIGDSRAYRLRKNQPLEQITKDHSLVQHLLDKGDISEDQVKTHPMRSVLIKVLGDSEGTVGADLDRISLDAQSGDRWLLCSDGLCGFVEKPNIEKVLLKHPDHPEHACEELVDLALRAGGPDNITCVIADLMETPGNQPVPNQPAVQSATSSNQDTAQRVEAQLNNEWHGPTHLTVGSACTTRLQLLKQELYALEKQNEPTLEIPLPTGQTPPAHGEQNAVADQVQPRISSTIPHAQPTPSDFFQTGKSEELNSFEPADPTPLPDRGAATESTAEATPPKQRGNKWVWKIVLALLGCALLAGVLTFLILSWWLAQPQPAVPDQPASSPSVTVRTGTPSTEQSLEPAVTPSEETSR